MLHSERENMKKNKYAKPYLVANLELLHKQKKIWLNPEYQRESVWTLSQKQLFIDSLLRDIDIPKFYFREVDKAGYEYEVVDGQQRLRAIFDFLGNGGKKFSIQSDADSVDGHEIKDCNFDQLHTDLQHKLNSAQLDTVVLGTGYTDEDIEEMFLRLQNGTPLNAAEKRRAIPGNMRNVVSSFSNNKVFSLCSFKDVRYANEDAIAKILHLLLSGLITDIKPISVSRTYENNKTITETNNAVTKLSKSVNFIQKAFKTKASPKLKKFSILTMSYLIAELLDKYNLAKFPSEFADSYLNFEQERIKNEELLEEKQDGRLAAYTDAARADSIQDLQYRHEFLRSRIIQDLPELVLKDTKRDFSEEQRFAIFLRDNGKCQCCDIPCDENAFHTDHITPHDTGGETKISNGQVLCPKCNLSKGNRLLPTLSQN